MLDNPGSFEEPQASFSYPDDCSRCGLLVMFLWLSNLSWTGQVFTMERSTVLAAIALFTLSLSAASMRASQLGALAADDYAVLGASTVTNTGSSVLNGNLGLYPGTSISGFPPGIVNGTIYDGVAAAQSGQTDATAAFIYLSGLAVTKSLTGEDLGNLTLTPGVYFYSSSAELTGPLTLNFEGLSDQNIVFQIGSTLTTASASSVIIEGAGMDDNVYWEVGSSATLGTTTSFIGDIIADESITLDTGATIACGDAIALNGAVTLDDNTISTCAGGTGGVGGTGTTGGVVSTTPEPGTFPLLATGILGVAGAMRRRLSA
jgi:type VI secretion system secreted protein VgrG